MFQYLIVNNVIFENPAKSIKNEKTSKKDPQILTNKEIELLLAQPSLTDIKGIRDKAMLELLYATGLKVTELVVLKVSDINFADASVRCGSGSKARIIPLGTMAQTALKEYMPLRNSNILIDNDNDYLFVNINGGKMSRQGFWKIIKYYADKAKIKKEITPGTLRNSFAVHLIESGADVSAVQEMLGHTAEFSTKIYSDVAGGRLGNVYKKTRKPSRKTK